MNFGSRVGEPSYRIRLFLAVVSLSLLSLGSSAQAASAVVPGIKSQRYQIALNKAMTLDVGQNVEKISMADPDVAEIVLMVPRKLLVHGNKIGTTNVLLWNAQNQVFASLDIEVRHDLELLKSKLYEVLPDEPIKVQAANEKIVMSGQVSNMARMDAAVKIAEGFMGKDSKESIVNLMAVGGAQQVMLEVKVAEVARSFLRKLDVRFRAAERGGDIIGGVVGQGGLGNNSLSSSSTIPISDALLSLAGIASGGAFLSFFNGNTFINVSIDAAKDNGLLRLLAEPTLTTQTGEKASFLSGGEFPIPVPQAGTGGGSTITIEYKPFGVGVEFLPVVLDSGRINLKTNISVSELSDEASTFLNVTNTSNIFAVPALRTRRASSTLELADGQTMSIAGLINNNTRQTANRFPGLGDVPVLGVLFRSQSFQKSLSELVIFVTPHLAQPIKPDQYRLPTDQFVEPDDTEFYLMGKMEGTARKPLEGKTLADEISLSGHKGGTDGHFGHQIYWRN